MVLNKLRKSNVLANLCRFEEAIEVHPFPAIHRPRLSTESYDYRLSQESFFKWQEVFANHVLSECLGSGLFSTVRGSKWPGASIECWPFATPTHRGTEYCLIRLCGGLDKSA